MTSDDRDDTNPNDTTVAPRPPIVDTQPVAQAAYHISQLTPGRTHDQLGRPFTGDAAQRRAQDREAFHEKQRRVVEDVARVGRGLPPLHAND